ncbi:MAG: FtsX-like permease family protein [Roseinatronobacter sp.]
MIAPALGALLSYWRANPVQLLMLVAGLALATSLWSGVQALNAQARSAYAQASALLGDGTAARVEGASGYLDLGAFATARRAGWAVSPLVEGRLTLNGQRVTVLGIDPLSAPGQAAAATGGVAELGPVLSGRAFAHPQSVAEMDGALPDLQASGAVPVGSVLMDIAQAQALLNMPDRITALTIAQTQRAGLTPLPDLIPGARLVAAAEGTDLAGLTDSFHLNLTAFGLLAFAVGLFIVHSTIGLAFEQRRAMLRTLRALGVPLRVLVGLLAAELGLLALFAGLFGIALGYAMAASLLPDVAATLRGLYGAPVPGSLVLDPAWVLAGLAMTFAGTALAGAQALAQLARMPLLATARPRAWAMASGSAMRSQACFGVALGLVALALANWPIDLGLIGGFALLACALLGAALVLPLGLGVLVGLGSRLARGPVAHWFWADTGQNLPRLSLALMALMLALAANIGVGTMVASFRATFIGWLDQRLVAEINVTPRDAAQAQELVVFLTPRVEAVLPLQRQEAQVAGQMAEIFAMRDHATFRDNWPLLAEAPQVWDRLAAGEGALINEQMHHRAGLGVGDALAVPGLPGLLVLGIHADYGNPRSQVIVTEAVFAARWPDTPVRQMALRTDDPDRVIAALLDEFGLSRDQITLQAQAKALSLQIFERTFLITGALNVLTLSVAALALFAALVTLSGIRLVQLAPLWALGLTPRHLAGLELARALVLAALTFVLALPVGLMLAQILLAVINVQAFGWRLPMQVFPGDWLRLGLWAGVAMLAAACLPAWRLLARGPRDLLRVFANER